MNFEEIIEFAQIFLLVLVRVFAILRISPLISSGSTPGIVRAGLSFFTAAAVFPGVLEAGYPIPDDGLSYALLVGGEALVGIITGFFLVLAYSSFLLAGQFFSLQMGFGASQVYDPLAQIQIPLMGQFINILAMYIFVGTGGFQKIFLFGVERSIASVRAIDFVIGKDYILRTIFGGLARIFEQAMIIAFPILGTLFLVSMTMGLLAKAAPQMNLLMLGFPIAISVAFLIMFLTIPFLVESFGRVIDASFEGILRIFAAGAAGAAGAPGGGS
ncbi:MAG: flagellar biosynthetic protein FliR [Spirochaetales bacterium]|jgi:flagellar biosynthesis protein FliR|nr:flagellar biosynthetic protein FliR [Spirochaetales bacterium]